MNKLCFGIFFFLVFVSFSHRPVRSADSVLALLDAVPTSQKTAACLCCMKCLQLGIPIRYVLKKRASGMEDAYVGAENLEGQADGLWLRRESHFFDDAPPEKEKTLACCFPCCGVIKIKYGKGDLSPRTCTWGLFLCRLNGDPVKKKCVDRIKGCWRWSARHPDRALCAASAVVYCQHFLDKCSDAFSGIIHLASGPQMMLVRIFISDVPERLCGFCGGNMASWAITHLEPYMTDVATPAEGKKPTQMEWK